MSDAGLYGATTISNSAGLPLPNIPVSVFNVDTEVLATLYTDNTASVEAANPTSTDALGNLTFYAAPGRYDISANGAEVIGAVVPDPSETTGIVQTIIPGDNVSVDSSNPAFPVISANGPGLDDVPIGDPTGVTFGSTVLSLSANAVNWVQFPTQTSGIALGQIGDDFPRFVIDADGIVYFGDGTFDPTLGSGATIAYSAGTLVITQNASGGIVVQDNGGGGVEISSPSGGVALLAELLALQGVGFFVNDGDPNGVVTATTKGDLCDDQSTPAFWIASGAGTVWTQIGATVGTVLVQEQYVLGSGWYYLYNAAEGNNPLDTTNLTYSFTVPASGQVRVQASFFLYQAGGGLSCGIYFATHGSPDSVATPIQMVDLGSIPTDATGRMVQCDMLVTGLTPGDNLQWDLAAVTTGAENPTGYEALAGLFPVTISAA